MQTTNPNKINWQNFDSYPGALIKSLQRRFESTDPFELTIHQLEDETKAPEKKVQEVLEKLRENDFLKTIQCYRCPFCETELVEDQIHAPECPHCDTNYESENRYPEPYLIYYRRGKRGRDVKWILTLHGMNTSGRWQEEFSWFIQNLYGHSIPVAIYKYGNIKFSPFLKMRQRFYAKRLIKNINRLCEEFEKPHHKRPDVIAHSFGTWLISKVLKENPDIKVGRIILTGSIVPPDFSWKTLIHREQVQAVMCHHSKKDFPVKISHYLIPGSGPSGVRGFNDRENVIHILEDDFGHSDYFKDENLSGQMRGKWASFLTRPADSLKSLADEYPQLENWKPSRWRLLTQFLLNLIILLLFVLFAAGIPAILIGYKEIWQKIF